MSKCIATYVFSALLLLIPALVQAQVTISPGRDVNTGGGDIVGGNKTVIQPRQGGVLPNDPTTRVAPFEVQGRTTRSEPARFNFIHDGQCVRLTMRGSTGYTYMSVATEDGRRLMGGSVRPVRGRVPPRDLDVRLSAGRYQAVVQMEHGDVSEFTLKVTAINCG